MKVIIVGKGARGGVESFILKAFIQSGVETKFLDSDKYFAQSVFNRIFNKIRRTPKYWGVKSFNDAVIKEAEEFTPDFILFFKPVLILPSTLVKLKAVTKTFSWYPDYIPTKKSASTYFFDSIPLYDCHLSFNFANVEELKKLGAKRSLFLPCAADLDCHGPVAASDEEKKELGADIVFMGTYANEKRAEYLERLCKDGYDIKIYGDGWEKHPKNSCLRQKNCIQFKALYCKDMSKVLNSSKISLSFVREYNKKVVTFCCRIYEIPASGGFMLHQRALKTDEVFKEGEEAAFFSSYEEMREKIDFYLKNEELRKKIVQKGKERVLREYLFIHRVQSIIEIFKELK
ncbi:MAG: glycosyltransferase [Candidatus Jorgensenbacteria bacterium]|nr:glycosyltransferase [Candidatus Jorgensenbacteria bacterium]